MLVRIDSGANSLHTYTQEEKVGIIDHLNHALEKSEQAQSYLPIPFEGNAVFTVVSDSVILS
jgi:hypothetical protein